jgi:hypothetical protein
MIITLSRWGWRAKTNLKNALQPRPFTRDSPDGLLTWPDVLATELSSTISHGIGNVLAITCLEVVLHVCSKNGRTWAGCLRNLERECTA